LFERNPALNGNLPEVLVERQHDARFGFGKIQENSVLPSGAIGPGPQYIMILGAKCLDNRRGKFSSPRSCIYTGIG
jgi:hypothetical protein